MSEEKSPKAAIIVESPTKTRTLARFLGKEYKLLATRGHVRDLPERSLAVDVDNGFQPHYVVIPKQKEHLAKLSKGLEGVAQVYLACDPDREGEAICWHVVEVFKLGPERRKRIEFNEITPRAVQQALAHPRDIDLQRVNAQQARRVLDRLVGYMLSPLLQHKLGGWRSAGSLSAGRVQSAALRLVVEREIERAVFVPQEYWRIWATLSPVQQEHPFVAELIKRDGQKAVINTGIEAATIAEELKRAKYAVAGLETKERLETPAPPFTTSTLQRQAARELGFSARQTIQIAQELYEGVELEEGTTGLITYMRTDSTRIAPEAREAAVQFIGKTYGREYVGPGVRGKKARGAQEAHEAIRPTHVELAPDAVAEYLNARQLALYRLIWRRFLASQMAPAVWEDTIVDVDATPETEGAANYTLQGRARVLKFPGWRAVYGAQAPTAEGNDDRETENNTDLGMNCKDTSPTENKTTAGRSDEADNGLGEALLPKLEPGELLNLLQLRVAQKFTQPPARYNEGSLVTALEKYGIGRPSTYAPIIETLKQRRYVETLRRQFVPTPLGVAVYQWLTEYFPQIMDLEFTARMEEKLDGVEHGQTDWVEVLRQFYDQFVQWVRTAEHSKPRPIEGETCPRCGGQMLQRFSRYGRFAGCERYPECGYVRDLGWPLQQQCPRCGQALELAVSKTEALEVKCSNQACDYVKRNDVAEEEEATPGDNEKTCPACGRPMVLRRYRGGKTFWGCSGYPECQHAEPHGAVQKKPPVDTDLDCPMCGEKLVVRHGRRGPFLGCGNYPKCQYTRNLTEAEKTQYLQVSQRADAPKEAQNQGSGREGPRKSAKTAKAGRSQGPKDGGQDGGGGR